MFHALKLNYRIIGEFIVNKIAHNVTINYQTDQDPSIEENMTVKAKDHLALIE